MEKIINRQIKISILTIFLCLTALSQTSTAQIRAGSGYLKMLHGARDVSLSGTLTGALDYSYSFYANPGATGFIREWQWSATYTNWISDLYNASLLYGRKIPTPWSRRTRFMLGVNFLGIPEFNNANATQIPVSANNLLVTGSVGQPLGWLSRYLSVGASFKYFDSELADFNSNAFIFDLGALYRTPRFPLFKPVPGLIDYLIFSTGVSLTNIGEPIVFITEETPLPQTLRAGAAVNIGAHHGLQISLAADYRKVRDEDGFVTFGSEISWRQLIAVRLGYSWEDNLLGHFTFGGSIRLDDLIVQNQIFGRNNALRVDLAANQNNPYFASPYHGTFTHQPIGPEGFRMLAPDDGAIIDNENVLLKYELTEDPDLYDDVEHWLLVDQDSSLLAAVTDLVEENSDTLLFFIQRADFLLNRQTEATEYLLTNLRAGDYFWTVLASDRDQHNKLARLNRKKIAKFHVTAPDPRVIAIDFNYSPWITQDDYQGELKVTVVNLGDRIARNFSLVIDDSTEIFAYPSAAKASGNQIYEQILPELPAGDTLQVHLDWRTPEHGRHRIQAEILKADSTLFSAFDNHFASIPKGIFATDDSVTVQEQYEITYDLPYVGKIFFDSSSAEIQPQYVRSWLIEPPLALFAKRLQQFPSIKIKLQGTIDPNSGETDIRLADQRAAAVRDTLKMLGVDSAQIQLLPGVNLPRRNRPSNTIDGRWVLEERRRVDITTDQKDEEALFHPLQTTYVEKKNVPVAFSADILGALPLVKGEIRLTGHTKTDSLLISSFPGKINLVDRIDWEPAQKDSTALMHWLGNTDYSLVLQDSSGREFRTRPKNTELRTQIVGRERRYYILANFAQSSAFYQFYWSNLIKSIPSFLKDPNVRICFSGHGCAIGSDAINARLSKQRSSAFRANFLRDIQRQQPNMLPEITHRTDPPRGFGESRPLEFKTHSGKTVLLGDDQTPLGRQLNRRVMVLFFTPR